MRPLQPGSNAAQALVAEASAVWAAASQAVRRANRWSVNGTTAFPSASAPFFRKSRTSAMMMRDDLGHVRTVRCSIELRVLVQEPLRSSPQFRARVNRLADLKACTCKAARLRLSSAGWRPFPATGRNSSRQVAFGSLRTSRTLSTGVAETPFQSGMRSSMGCGWAPAFRTAFFVAQSPNQSDSL